MSAALMEPPTPTGTTSRDSESLYEIIDGMEVEMPPMSMESGVLASELSRHIANFAVGAKFGNAYTEILIRLSLTDRSRDRRPDVVYVSYKRWPKGTKRLQDNAWSVVPEICVEVISPSDHITDVEEKIDEYFESGVSQVWVVFPKSRRIKVYRSPTEEDILTVADTLKGGDVLPGFELRLAEFFAD